MAFLPISKVLPAVLRKIAEPEYPAVLFLNVAPSPIVPVTLPLSLSIIKILAPASEPVFPSNKTSSPIVKLLLPNKKIAALEPSVLLDTLFLN